MKSITQQKGQADGGKRGGLAGKVLGRRSLPSALSQK